MFCKRFTSIQKGEIVGIMGNVLSLISTSMSDLVMVVSHSCLSAELMNLVRLMDG